MYGDVVPVMPVLSEVAGGSPDQRGNTMQVVRGRKVSTRNRQLSATWRAPRFLRGVSLTSPVLVRDATAMSPDYQFDRLKAKEKDLARKLIRAGQDGDVAKMTKLALILADCQGKMQLVADKMRDK